MFGLKSSKHAVDSSVLLLKLEMSLQVYKIPWICTALRTLVDVCPQLTKPEVMSVLSRSSVLMRQRDRVEETLDAMQQAGAASLHVISDFDMTLTRFAHNGKRVPTTHNILDSRLLVDEECGKKMRELLNTYYPIEIDASRTVEEKLPFMVEWWTKVHHLLVEQKIRKDLLAPAVRESNAATSMLRDGYRVFFDHLAQRDVPLLIFSGGVGDVLEEVIRQHGVFRPSVHVIANYMDFDHAGVLRAFKGDLIHTFNKRKGALSHVARFPELQARRSVLLLGDSLGDLNMAAGVPEPRRLLTVGFLNDQVDARRESYVNSFDIVVLAQDDTMDVPNAILRFVMSSGDNNGN
ncbi:7-methylguanosine phosphate-specific 5'-nucleotidase-like isoform X1 [Phyllopteryx taeniolatus]|uniref:7-methylguanosine phosphate-specific 5'-nucleotidase-like isoform X1 n=1 Tax=Phyllopteryx taeniolatus TaxID=161469 RepID=UPI002AD20697|nr:7-methylguanosine phosphate-specific 5'-nucleotidase-like isoform X1 [Phyllopteryx taeniolatus]